MSASPSDKGHAPPEGWFDAVARFMGPAYLRYSFTQGTQQEVEFLVHALALGVGTRVLDVGCGPGRHALALERRGLEVVGVDRSREFMELAAAEAATDGSKARFVRADVRALPLRDRFDAVICMCQGGFGLLGGRDEPSALAEMVGRLRPGGRIAVSAFSAAFAIRHLEEGEDYDVATGVFHETATVRDEQGEERAFELWTTCFTSRELKLLARANSIEIDGIYGVRPGGYATRSPTLEHPELLLIGRRAPTGVSNPGDGAVP